MAKTMKSIAREPVQETKSKFWRPAISEYSVRQFPETGKTSAHIGHRWRTSTDVPSSKFIINEAMRNHGRDLRVILEGYKSETTEQFGRKHSEHKIMPKPSSCREQHYIKESIRKVHVSWLTNAHCHGTSEMKASFVPPQYTASSRSVTDQYSEEKPPKTPPLFDSADLNDHSPIYTSDDTFERHLDPYVTTSRFYHRPYTQDTLKKISNSNDIVTYYTFADIPRVRGPIRDPGPWWLPTKPHRRFHDRETFTEKVKEEYVRNRPAWTPSAMKSETQKQFSAQRLQTQESMELLDEKIKEDTHKRLSTMCETDSEKDNIKSLYLTENKIIGSNKPLCSILEQHAKKNECFDRVKSVKLKIDRMPTDNRLRFNHLNQFASNLDTAKLM